MMSTTSSSFRYVPLALLENGSEVAASQTLTTYSALVPYPGGMPQRCKVCSHPKRGEIDRDLLQTNESNPTIAARYSLVAESVRRHRNNHLQVTTAQVNEAHNARTIVGYAHELYVRASKLLDRAESSVATSDEPARSIQAAAATLREVRSSIELLARLVVTEPESKSDSTNDLLDSLILEQLQANTMAALEPGNPDISDADVIEDDEPDA